MGHAHDDLLTEYEAETTDEAVRARKESLSMLRWPKVQQLASKAGVYAGSSSRDDLATALAEEGYFAGGVGDRSIYRYDAEDGTVTDTGYEM